MVRCLLQRRAARRDAGEGDFAAIVTPARNLRLARVDRIGVPTSPIAFLLTFRTYGTWLHGDPRGSFQRRPGQAWPAALSPQPLLEGAMRRLLAHPPVRLDAAQRRLVTEAIDDACRRNGWVVHALAVRTEHVHIVLTTKAGTAPERVMTALKARATRRMVERGALGQAVTCWSRHGSTRYVWTRGELEIACRYVNEHEG